MLCNPGAAAVPAGIAAACRGGKTKEYCLGVLAANVIIYKVAGYFAAEIAAFRQRGGRKFRKAITAD